MRWLSVFTGGRSQGWMPVTNNDDHEETGMDDLMRMAMGQFHDEDENLIRNDHYDEGAPVFQHGSLSVPTSLCSSSVQSGATYQTLSSCQDATAESDGGKSSFSCSRPKLQFPGSRWYFVLLSLAVVVSYIGLNVGLGYFSLLVYKTDKLVIDKSVKSFSIPNHKAYKNFEAMMIARRDNSSVRRSHRRNIRASPAVPQMSRSERDVTEQTLLKVTEETLNKERNEDRIKNKRHKSLIKGFSSSTKTQDSYSEKPIFNLGPSIDATLQRFRRSSGTREIGCMFDYQSIVKWKMHVIYLAHGDSNDSNMFTKERLETIHDIEQKIIAHPGFHDFCLRDPDMAKDDPALIRMKGCLPLNSLMTYFFPSKDSHGRIFYDGMGDNIDDISSALKLAMTHETFYYYVDEKINKTFQKSRLIRSEVLFGAPLQGIPCVGNHWKDEDNKFKNFVVTYIDLLSKASTDKVHVLYGGNEIFDYEVSTSFWSDVRLAIISLAAIFILMLVLSLSLYLTVVGMIIIALSFPISLFFYRFVFGINAFGILNGAAAFVIIGIGVDDVFVFVNIYRQSSHMKKPIERIKYTVKTAGVATFFTSFTTAAAFAANLASSIPAVYEFGLFMSLIVSSCWLSVIVLMPPLLYLHACFFEPIEKLFFSCFSCLSPQETREPLSSMQEYSQQEEMDNHLYQEDDVPMLDIDDQGVNISSITDDEPLLDADSSQSSISQGNRMHCQEETGLQMNYNSNNNMCLGRLKQKGVMFLTNRIVIPGRYIVIAFYVLVFIASCLLMVQLQPSTHPPQLFRPDTNVQRLLDLKANFSIIDTLHCDQCSGLYKVKATVPSSKRHHESQIYAEKPRSSNSHKSRTLAPPPRNGDSKKSSGDTDLHEDMTATVDKHELNNRSETHNRDESYRPDIPDNMDWEGNIKNNNNELDILSDGLKNTNTKTLVQAMARGLAELLTFPARNKGGSGDENRKTTLAPVPLTARPVRKEIPPIPSYNRYQHLHKPTSQTKGIPRKTHFGITDIVPSSGNSSSLDENFNACKEQSCNDLKDRPLMESGATVYVVFGITGLDLSDEDDGHVLDQFKGTAKFDTKFSQAFNFSSLLSGGHRMNLNHLRELCRVCHILANNTELVTPGSAQCLPGGMYQLHSILRGIEECRDLPSSLSIYHHQAPAHAEGGFGRDGSLLWLAFAFESTTSKGQAYFQAYKQYEKWEALIDHIKRDVLAPDSPLSNMFQTSEFWTKVLMEVVAVNSAIYGLVLSMLICVLAVAVFTGHLVLLIIIIVTIVAMICCVVGVFYLAGWELGAVEAVSLSILVGSSVDYCVHVVEGFILAGRYLPESLLKNEPKGALRRQRTSFAVRHIGVAILCSALTTIIAAIPLTQTFIQPFAKFGSILLINTTVSMVMTLTLAVALLAAFGPARYRGTLIAHVIAAVCVACVVGVFILALYVASVLGVSIPGPAGAPLFSS